MNPSAHQEYRGRLTGVLVLLTLTFIWGTSFPFIKIVVEKIGFIYYVAIRFSLASLLLLPLIAAKGCREALLRNFRGGVVLGLLYFCGITLQGWGMEYTSASNAAFITGLSTVLVYAIEVAMGGERFSIKLTLAVALSTVGLYLLSATENLPIGLGDLIVLGGAVFWALQIIAVGKYTREMDLLFLLFYENIFTALGGILATPFTGFSSLNSLVETMLPLLYLAIFCTILANALQLYGQKLTSNTEAAIVYLMEPVFATLLSFILLGEALSPRQIIGAGAIICAMALSSIGSSH